MDEAYLIGIRIALEDEVSRELGAFGHQIEAYERTIDAAARGWEVGQGPQNETGAPQNRPEPEGRNRPETSQADDSLGFLACERPVAAPTNEAQAPPPKSVDPVCELAPYLDNSSEREPAPPSVSYYLQDERSQSEGQEKPPYGASEESERYLRGGYADIAGLGDYTEPVSLQIEEPGEDLPRDARSAAVGNSENQQTKRPDTGQVFGSQAASFRPPGQPDLSAGQESVAPIAQSPASSPTEGDVYLDGSRLGRWMADRLGREIDRAQGGFTGFDPRLGIAWPGALHGT